jgi:hypothetical protein
VHLREGKTLGSEEGKGLGSRLCYEQRKEFEQGLYCAWSEMFVTEMRGDSSDVEAEFVNMIQVNLATLVAVSRPARFISGVIVPCEI